MAKNPVQRPSSLQILQIAGEHISDSSKLSNVSLINVLGPPSSNFVFNAFTRIAARLDSLDSFESRITKERREKLLKRLMLLCEDGADCLFEDHGESIHLGVLLGRDGKVERLLEQEKDVNEKWDLSGWTPLHLAAQAGNFKIATVLLRFNADKSVGDKFGHTPYYYASQARYDWSYIFHETKYEHAEFAS